MTKIVDEQKAKGGRSGRQVLTILIAALILLAIGWFFVEMYGKSIDPQASAPVTTAPAQSETQPAPAPATNNTMAPATDTTAPAAPATTTEPAPATPPSAPAAPAAPAQ